MKKSLFSEVSPGAIVSIAGNEIAFVPDSLPPGWEFPGRLWPLLAEAKSQIGILEGIGRVLPNPGILLRPLEDREAIRSSRLEGTYATPQELLLFELEPRVPTSDRDPRNDHREVFNYRRALHLGVNDSRPLCLRLLRDMHRILLGGVRGRDKNPGNFRNCQVAIGGSRRFVPPPPESVMGCLYEMESYFHVEDSRYDPLVNCFLMHYQFETIHPFNDGNGRIGRLLLAIMMQQKCAMTKPWLYLSEFFEQHRDEYIDRLFQVSTQAKWSAWVEFCLHATVAQAKATITRCERLLAIREDFNGRLNKVGGNVRLYTIMEEIFRSPFIRVSDVPELLGISYPTAKSDMERLADAGILKELSGVSPKTYYAPEVFSVAYDELPDS
ncbi:Adenosine monophosphate-protein transferase SoFic [Rosistilla oblonga]|uniref:Fic family protein n=1 Tax=Rosistilla oblonga TaxID=2527990 RepID=UPI0011879366|nr:Fic/DOC family N-terminal domain-containing protein [Rosistilla oblonga]QDV15029.1 Adenosine monophosphate-protein transferase SoFic [Rosistilla oblonga]